MTKLTELRRPIVELRNRLIEQVASDPQCANLSPPRRRYLRPIITDTAGYWAGVGSLGRSISVEFWLDHFSGLPSPKAWFGISCRSPQILARLLKLPPLAHLRTRLIERSSRNVTWEEPYRFKQPLRSQEFDVLVQEHYRGERDFLGAYLNYSWPFSGKSQNAIVRDSTNLSAAFCAAFEMLAGERSIRTPGPWARPDPRTEKAAVRHVRRYLRKLGYYVRSRESEICGYDLHAEGPSDELHVEVKGCKGTDAHFFISRTERDTAASDKQWRLALVTNALDHPQKPHLLTGKQMLHAFSLEPLQWEAIYRS